MRVSFVRISFFSLLGFLILGQGSLDGWSQDLPGSPRSPKASHPKLNPPSGAVAPEGATRTQLPAGGAQQSPPRQSTKTYELRVRGGETEKFTLVEGRDEAGDKEVVIYFHEDRMTGVFDTIVPVMWGRDLDGDQYYDAWFFVREDGVAVHARSKHSQQPDGWDVASRILRQEGIEDRSIFRVTVEALKDFTLSGNYRSEYLHALRRDQIELLSLEILEARLVRSNPGSPELDQMRLTISEGWADISKRIGPAYFLNFTTRYAVDVVLGRLLAGKAFPRTTSWIQGQARKLTQSELAQILHHRFVSHVTGRGAAALNRIKSGGKTVLSRTGSGMTAVPARWAAMKVGQRVKTLVQGMRARSKIFRGVTDGLGRIWNRKLYIVGSQTVQVVAEAAVRIEQIRDPNIAITVQNLVSEKDFRHNFLYMTTESVLFTGIGESIPGKRGLAICALVSLANSALFSFVIKGEADLGRVALDTTWEMTAGNIQVNRIDLPVIREFDALSKVEDLNLGIRAMKGRPMRFLGYALAFTDQAIGYGFYSALTSQRDGSRNQKAVASARESEIHDSTPLKTAPIPSAPPQGGVRLAMIPVFAPEAPLAMR